MPMPGRASRPLDIVRPVALAPNAPEIVIEGGVEDGTDGGVGIDGTEGGGVGARVDAFMPVTLQ
jgi:hypothetical protein